MIFNHSNFHSIGRLRLRNLLSACLDRSCHVLYNYMSGLKLAQRDTCYMKQYPNLDSTPNLFALVKSRGILTRIVTSAVQFGQVEKGRGRFYGSCRKSQKLRSH